MQFVVVCGCRNQGYKCTADTCGYWTPFQDGMDQFLCYLVVVIGHIVSVSLRGHMRGSRPSACHPSTFPPKKSRNSSHASPVAALAKALECLGHLLECFLLVRSLLLPVVVVATACSTVGAKILQKDVGRALLVMCLALPGSMGRLLRFLELYQPHRELFFRSQCLELPHCPGYVVPGLVAGLPLPKRPFVTPSESLSLTVGRAV